MDQPALFEPEDPPPLRRPRGGYRQPAKRVAYRKYTALTRLPCDDCMALHIEGPAPVARAARTVRQVTGQPSRYLCGEHAQQWRELDARP